MTLSWHRRSLLSAFAVRGLREWFSRWPGMCLGVPQGWVVKPLAPLPAHTPPWLLDVPVVGFSLLSAHCASLLSWPTSELPGHPPRCSRCPSVSSCLWDPASPHCSAACCPPVDLVHEHVGLGCCCALSLGAPALRLGAGRLLPSQKDREKPLHPSASPGGSVRCWLLVLGVQRGEMKGRCSMVAFQGGEVLAHEGHECGGRCWTPCLLQSGNTCVPGVLGVAPSLSTPPSAAGSQDAGERASAAVSFSFEKSLRCFLCGLCCLPCAGWPRAAARVLSSGSWYRKHRGRGDGAGAGGRWQGKEGQSTRWVPFSGSCLATPL